MIHATNNDLVPVRAMTAAEIITYNPRKTLDDRARQALRDRARREREAEAQRLADRLAAQQEKIRAAAAARIAAQKTAEQRALDYFNRQLGIAYRPSMVKIMKRICRATGITPDQIISDRRTRSVCFARQAVVYWTVRLTKMSYPQISYRLGGRDHTTAIHATQIYPKKRWKQGRYLRPIVRSDKLIPERQRAA